jgi:hypothetical protein
MKNILDRQHGETEITEIVGDTVESILAVTGTGGDSIVFFYIFLRGLWLRVFLDEGVLFLSVCDGPNEEDDLGQDDAYLDLSKACAIKGQEISRACMKNGFFRITFKSGVELIFEQSGAETKFRVQK